MTVDPVVIERVETERGELVLRRVGPDFEVISNGVFLMDTRNGESERVLVGVALAAHPNPRQVLIGGLGVGFSIHAALADHRVERVVVVEIEPTIIEWNRTHLADINRRAVADPRVTVVESDLLDHLRRTQDRYDAICLDVDNGPEWTVTPDNLELYDDTGTALVASRLRPGGVASVWSAARSSAYEAVLARHFADVEIHEIDVPRGEPDVVLLASGRVCG